MEFSCKRCAECCRSYWITMLPAERAAMAKALRLSGKKFTEKYTQLLLQLFPTPEIKQKGLVVSAKKIPAKILGKITKQLKEKPVCFIALPSLAFKRNKGVCVLFNKTKSACLVHKTKPGQCTLFPFISLSENPDFSSLYGFCEGLKGSTVPADWKKRVEEHYKNFSKYFESIQARGFRKVWRAWPKKGVLLLKNQEICSIKEKDFFEMIRAFS